MKSEENRMPIKRYLGDNKFEVRFNSGKEIELTQDEIDEIIDDNNQTIKYNINNNINKLYSNNEKVMDVIYELENNMDDNETLITKNDILEIKVKLLDSLDVLSNFFNNKNKVFGL
jgi:archaellin